MEIFVQAIQGIIRKDSKILELGTGTGAISIALAKNYKDISILATDINKFAIKIAKKNSEINKVDKIIDFKESNWFSNIKDNKYDFIITNPPYIPKENSSIFSKLSDPKNSLYASKNGLADIYTIIKNSLKKFSFSFKNNKPRKTANRIEVSLTEETTAIGRYKHAQTTIP